MSTRQKFMPLIVIAILLGGLGSVLLLAKPAPISPMPTASQTSARTYAAQQPKPDSEKAIRAAYLRAWAVRAKALERLDVTHLDEVLTGTALRHVIDEVTAARKAGAPARVIATHDIVVLQIDAVTASVDDRYIDRSVLLDPRTHRPTTTPTPRRLHKTFTLRLEDQTWKIARVIGYSSR